MVGARLSVISPRFFVISTEANEVSEVEKSHPNNKARFLDTLFYVYSTQNNGSK